MSIGYKSQLAQTKAMQNPIFEQYLDSYLADYSIPEEEFQIISEIYEEIPEELIYDEVNITPAELEYDMTMCRYFEGDE